MMKNIKHYYLYFFALIFSVMLYFAFSTLQYNGAVLNQVEEGGTAAAGFKVATYLLWFIVLVFVLYANHLFVRRRSKEIGMYQLIGMTKALVFRLLAFENAILFGSAVLLGVLGGFLGSRVFALVLLKVVGVSSIVGITFSVKALLNTLLVFAILLVIILCQLFIFIQRQTLIQMFHSGNVADETIRKFNVWHMLLGLIGLGCIIYGYYTSQTMFEGPGSELVRRMTMVLFITIFGTLLVFRYSVALIINIWRTKKNGHVSSGDVIAFLPIMHRMKSNAKSLTLIAVLTAVSLGINTLAYISYYSIEKEVINSFPSDFTVVNNKADEFEALMKEEGLSYSREDYEYIQMLFDFPALLENREDVNTAGYYITHFGPVLPASKFDLKLSNNDAIIYGINGYSTNLIKMKDGGAMKLEISETDSVTLNVLELKQESLLRKYGTTETIPTIVVSDELFTSLFKNKEAIKHVETHFNLKNKNDELTARTFYEHSKANAFSQFTEESFDVPSQQQYLEDMKKSLGLIIFVTGFLGLAFLIASGSILYFKQMSEAEQEKGSYTILRKIGYSERDLLKGVFKKQLFNFGVIIIVGLFHSYFAVKSGWWFFGTEFGVPMITMMILYVVIYIIFALLTILYYKKIIKEAL